MSTDRRSFEEVRGLLGRLDHSIDQARRKRLGEAEPETGGSAAGAPDAGGGSDLDVVLGRSEESGDPGEAARRRAAAQAAGSAAAPAGGLVPGHVPGQVPGHVPGQAGTTTPLDRGAAGEHGQHGDVGRGARSKYGRAKPLRKSTPPSGSWME